MRKTDVDKKKSQRTFPKRHNLTSITYALCGLTMLGISILTIVSSIQVDGFLREELRLRISDVVMMMAKKIDGDLHSQIRTASDDKSAAYLKLKNELWDMREHGTEIANAYTMRRLENGDVVFIVDGSAKDQNATGDIYPSVSVTQTLSNALNATPETVTTYTEKEITHDDWGVWLSAFAPIFTSSGKLDGIVGIDVSAKSIRKHELQYLATIVTASFIVILMTLPFVFRLMNLIKKMTAELEKKNKDFQRLLDNSGQGFLSFSSNLIIDNEYSRSCETMLGQLPAGKNAAEVFFHNDKTKADLFDKIISSVVSESEECVQESMLSLLPAEIQHNSTVLKAEYKILENDKFMVILTDITQERRMTEMLNKERLRLELIVMAVSDSRNFFDTIQAFREFIMQLPKMLNERISPQILTKELYREIHTNKGLLNQFSFPDTPKMLHEIEGNLSKLLKLGNSLTRKNIAEVISLPTLQSSFNKDLAILTDALGEDFLANGESIVLTSEQALKIEQLAQRLLQGESIDISVIEIRDLLNEITLLRKVSFYNVLMGFEGVIQQAAKRVGKEIAPIVVKGGKDVWIDPQAYQAFLRALIHVFRNAVAHGIESPEARWETDKDEMGKITCYVATVGNTIKLTIADDGAGINLDALRERVAAAGIYTGEKIAAMPDAEIINFIFIDTISTQREVTELAGRGVGLAAVQNETKNMGGEVVVRTIAGQGTQFIFTLPLQQEILSEGV